MSHQTGITVSLELAEALADITNEKEVRAVKISIQYEQLVESGRSKISGDWISDYNKSVCPFVTTAIEDKSPCFILYRLDVEAEDGTSQWIFITFVPDEAPVRQKMVYAATRATLKSKFGFNRIKDDMFGTASDDVDYSGYEKHLQSENAPPPLTAEEIEVQEINKSMNKALIGTTTKKHHIVGLEYPVDDSAKAAMKQLKSNEVNYVQLKIELDTELIALSKTEASLSADKLHTVIPRENPSYHFFNYKHEFNGEPDEALIFIYSCPGYQCSVKERMMYASCKSKVLDFSEGEMGLKPVRRLEIGEMEGDGSSELNANILFKEVHPQVEEKKQAFSRPARPGRGGRRIVKK
eukprot:Nk52_evm23s294 gene=Nk52_evmTU23s294